MQAKIDLKTEQRKNQCNALRKRLQSHEKEDGQKWQKIRNLGFQVLENGSYKNLIFLITQFQILGIKRRTEIRTIKGH